MRRPLSERLERLAKITDGLRADLGRHDQRCDDWVALVALHPDDLDELLIVEVWGIPVVGWDDVPRGRFRVLCEGQGFIVPSYDTFEEVADVWKYALPRPDRSLDYEDRPVSGSGSPSSPASNT